MPSQRTASPDVSTSCEMREIFVKSLTPSSDWPDKDELLDVVYWYRQLFGALIGVAWGLVPLHGFIGILLYLALSTFIIHFYITSFQNVDEEKLGGFWELAKEGFASSFASFMITWILVYTAVHSGENSNY